MQTGDISWAGPVIQALRETRRNLSAFLERRDGATLKVDDVGPRGLASTLDALEGRFEHRQQPRIFGRERSNAELRVWMRCRHCICLAHSHSDYLDDARGQRLMLQCSGRRQSINRRIELKSIFF